MAKLEILKDYEEWLKYQLENKLSGWQNNYIVNAGTPTEVAQEEVIGYSQVLASKKELVKTQLEIAELENKGE